MEKDQRPGMCPVSNSYYSAPAIFDIEGFGLVPRSSVFGIVEIKKSNH